MEAAGVHMFESTFPEAPACNESEPSLAESVILTVKHDSYDDPHSDKYSQRPRYTLPMYTFTYSPYQCWLWSDT